MKVFDTRTARRKTRFLEIPCQSKWKDAASRSSAHNRAYSSKRRNIYMGEHGSVFYPNLGRNTEQSEEKTDISLHVFPSPMLPRKLHTVRGNLLRNVIMSWVAIRISREESHGIV